MEPYSDDRLIAELRALRPSPRPRFAAELDARAAAGFPRRSSQSAHTPVTWLAEWLRAQQARRLALSLAGGAVAAVLVATVVVSQASHDAASNRSVQSRSAHHGELLSQVELFDQSSGGEGAAAGASGGASAGAAEKTEVAPPAVLSHATSAGANSSAGQVEVAPSAAPAAGNAGHRDVERSAEI